MEAINAKKVSGASLPFCSWKDDSARPEIIYPFSDSNDIFRVYELPKRTAASGRRVHSRAYGIRLGPKASGAWANYVSDVTQPGLPPVLRKINRRELVAISQVCRPP